MLRVDPTEVDILSTGNINYAWLLCVNPVITGVDTASWQNVTNSGLQYDISRSNLNTVTDFGSVITGGYGSSSNSIKMSAGGTIATYYTIGTDIAGVSDQLVLLVAPIDSNGGTVYAGITMSEFS
jgi:hypothetical protein